MLHMSHFKISKKNKLLMNTLNHQEKKQEVLFVKTFIYKEHVIQRDQKTEMKIHMNINVKMNMINQCFIIKQDMLLLNVDLSRFI